MSPRWSQIAKLCYEWRNSLAQQEQIRSVSSNGMSVLPTKSEWKVGLSKYILFCLYLLICFLGFQSVFTYSGITWDAVLCVCQQLQQFLIDILLLQFEQSLLKSSRIFAFCIPPSPCNKRQPNWRHFSATPPVLLQQHWKSELLIPDDPKQKKNNSNSSSTSGYQRE